MPSSSKQKATKGIQDGRFARIASDPRFRLPSKKNRRVQLDSRFSRMLKDDDFSKKASVDRRGRKLPKDAGRKELERLYDLDNEEDEDNFAPDDEESGDDDITVKKELQRVNRKYDPAREGGFSESSSDEESSTDDDDEAASDAEEDDASQTSGPTAVSSSSRRPPKEAIPEGEITSRLAIVNLDWEHIRAVDLLAVARSFCPANGKILRVSIYPSAFGKEQMEREEQEGPPAELFGDASSRSPSPFAPSSSDDDDDDDDEEDEDERIRKQLMKAQTGNSDAPSSSSALRAYQLSRLRYYYAVLEADTPATAHVLYTDMDGREYLATSNFFDLRFVPAETSFTDDTPRDEAADVPAGYKPADFVTAALTHSKVQLTWDEDDRGMKEAQKRAFSRRELDDADLAAYIGSDSESDASAADDAAALRAQLGQPAEQTNPVSAEPKQSKAELARAALRAKLGLPAEPTAKTPAKPAPEGNMQVTFTAGISAGGAPRAGAVFANAPEDVRDETTRDKYIRKERERKARRKEKAKGGAADPQEEEGAEQMVPAGSDEEISASEDEVLTKEDPFDDPFFADPAGANAAAKKAAKQARRAQAEEHEARGAEARRRERAELELLLADEGGEGAGAFDMARILKAEKLAGAKGKAKSKKKQKQVEGEVQDAFEMNVADPRFRGVFDSHEFAIDPNNPRFSGSRGMKRLLEEGRRKRKGREDEGEGPRERKVVGKGGDADVDKLLAKMKRRKAA